MLPGPSPFNPSSAHAAATSHLFIVVLLLIAAIFVLDGIEQMEMIAWTAISPQNPIRLRDC